MADWKLSADAQRDLRSIRHYTEQTWGLEQAHKYRAQLRACIVRLVADPDCGKDLSVIKPGMRLLRCKNHCIFSLTIGTAPPLIVAILHERMDLLARIAERIT